MGGRGKDVNQGASSDYNEPPLQWQEEGEDVGRADVFRAKVAKVFIRLTHEWYNNFTDIQK